MSVINRNKLDKDSVSLEHTWSRAAPAVRQALRYLRTRGEFGVTAEEMVTWDRTHGRRLFEWRTREAAEAWRLAQARNFLNHFRLFLGKHRVRAYISVPEETPDGISRRYFPVETIAARPELRQLVVEELTARLVSTIKELRMWRLPKSAQAQLFRKLREALNPID